MQTITIPAASDLVAALGGPKRLKGAYDTVYDTLALAWRHYENPAAASLPDDLAPVQAALLALFPATAQGCANLILSRAFERLVDSLDAYSTVEPLSDGLVDLVFTLQPLGKNARVMGAFCQTADFEAEAYLRQPDAQITILDYTESKLAALRREVMGASARFAAGSTLESTGIFDAGFVNYFNFKVTAPAPLLAEKIGFRGTCVALTQSSNLYYSGYRDVRRTYVEAGLVLAVVTLAGGTASSGDRSLVVFGKNETGRIRFVDASALATEDRGTLAITPDDARRIADLALGTYDDPVALSIAMQDVAAAGYMLEPAWYLNRVAPAYPAVPLADVVTAIHRSPGATQKDLVSPAAAAPGAAKYLEVANIDNHTTEGELARLAALTPAQEKHLLQDGDVVITKMGPAHKSAVVSVDPAKKILPSGNFIVIRPDPSKVDPLYLSLYLASPAGRSALKLATSGDNTPVLSVKLLKDMPVALPTLVQQETVCEHAGALTHRIEDLKRELQEAKTELADYLAASIG